MLSSRPIASQAAKCQRDIGLCEDQCNAVRIPKEGIANSCSLSIELVMTLCSAALNQQLNWIYAYVTRFPSELQLLRCKGAVLMSKETSLQQLTSTCHV